VKASFIALFAALAVVPTAVAHRPATAKETVALRAAAVSAFANLCINIAPCKVTFKRIRLSRVRVSTVDPHFATAEVDVLYNPPVSLGGTTLFWHGQRRWAVIDSGDEGVGCGLLTPAVWTDLFGAHYETWCR